MELRWYVVVAQDTILRDILRSGGDPHQLVGDRTSELVGKPIRRGTAKTAVFGRLYGRQIESFIREYKFPREDALTLLSTIDDMFPGIKKYNSDVKEELKKGYVTSYFNRRRRFGLITEKNRSEIFRQAVNDKIQSPASDTNLFVMLHLFDLWKRGDSPIRPMWPVHDSILCSIPDESQVPFLRKEIETYSKELVKGAMDFKVEIKVGPDWGNTEEINDD
jgi:DNA polymerase I-like protein with 3'-5' exonuclease and polymerase domains